ncbi:MAG TPA: hypothetical protein VGL34_24910 [Steroidobacteraceae bacterium]
MKNVLRQGDVCLIAVDEIPQGAKKHPSKGRKVILALGEATGHHHRFEFLDTSHNVKLYVAEGGARYVHVTKAAELLHEEHSTVKVPQGKYLLPRQVEYTPAELRQVQD